MAMLADNLVKLTERLKLLEQIQQQKQQQQQQQFH